MILRLEIPIKTIYNENVFGVNLDGNIIWQIPKVDLLYDDSPFVGLIKEDKKSVWAINWDGTALLLDVNTGEILKREWRR